MIGYILLRQLSLSADGAGKVAEPRGVMAEGVTADRRTWRESLA